MAASWRASQGSSGVGCWRRRSSSSDSGGLGLAVRLVCVGGVLPGILAVGSVLVWVGGWVVLLIDWVRKLCLG